MKIFFVNPPFKAEHGKFMRECRSPSIGRSGVFYYPLWMMFAALVVEKEGFEVEFIDCPAKPLNEIKSLEYIKEHANGTRLFVLSTSTASIYNDVSFGGKLKELYPDSFILLVGTHPSALPEETLLLNQKIGGVARKEFDYIVRDLAFAIRDNSPLDSVKGLSFRNGEEIKHNPDADYIENLDEIPFASKFIKERLCVTDYFIPSAAFPEIQIYTGRGCPAQCNFCVYPQTQHGHKYRMRSARNVVDEFKYIAQNFPEVKGIVIEDDTFTINKERVFEICQMLIDEGLHKRFRWICNSRANLDVETMKILKKAGCRLLLTGIESMNQNILNNIKKGTTIEGIKKFVDSAKKAGILVHACYMFGNEGETKETMERTLEAALSLKTDTAQFYPLNAYPGTRAYQWALSNGYTNGKFEEYCLEDGTLNCVTNLPGISSKELTDFCGYARRKYYLRPWFILHRIWIGLSDFEDMKRALKAFSVFKKYLFKEGKGGA